jgi:hypothetical protein
MPIVQRVRRHDFFGLQINQRKIGVFADFDAAFLCDAKTLRNATTR